MAQRYDATGTPLGDVFTVNNFTTGRQRVPSVAIDAEGDFVVAWTSSRGGPDPDGHEAGVFARRFDSDGTPEADEFRVSDRQRTVGLGGPTAAMNDSGEFAIAWTFFNVEADRSINIQQFDADGSPRGAGIAPLNPFGGLIDLYLDATPPELSMGDRGDLIVAAQEDSGFILTQRLSAEGVPQGETITTIAEPMSLGLAQDSAGNFLLAWASLSETLAQRYSAAGVPLEDAIAVADSPAASNLTAFLDDQGQFAVVWEHDDGVEPRQILARQFVGTSPLTVANVSDAAGVDLLGDKMGRMPMNQLVVQFSGAVSTDGGDSGRTASPIRPTGNCSRTPSTSAIRLSGSTTPIASPRSIWPPRCAPPNTS